MASGRKLMVAVDDSETSAYAFTWALYNLVRENDGILVLNVTPSMETDLPTSDLASDYISLPPASSATELEAFERSVTEESTALVNKYLLQCAQKNIPCEGEVVKGDPSSWIVDEADRRYADIVIVGSHAYGLLKRTLLGSISDYVLHNANCPVAIIRKPQSTQALDSLTPAGLSRKIVIAIDESKETFNAFKWALHNFCRESDKIIVYHVHHPTDLPARAVGTGEFGMEEVYMAADVTEEEDVKARNQSEHLVEKCMQYASKVTKVKCEGMVVTGPTAQKICESLQVLQADAVVVGSHGHGMIARTFLGSVSDYLSHNSPCPLIVVKLPKEKENDIAKHEEDEKKDTTKYFE
uniref:UspA domain-containing protein n=1 Tax=Araucaria cunninghamii TaxID=56994 RepID=A0A0D6R5Q5_ARACU